MRSIRRISGVNMDYEPGGNAAQRSKGYTKRVSNNKIRTAGRSEEHAAIAGMGE